MSLKEEKELAVKELDQVNDVETIRLIRQILKMAAQSLQDKDLKPFTQKELIERAMKSEEDYKAGRVITLKELKVKYNIK